MLECLTRRIKKLFFIKIRYLQKERKLTLVLAIINYPFKIEKKLNIKEICSDIYPSKIHPNNVFI